MPRRRLGTLTLALSWALLLAAAGADPGYQQWLDFRDFRQFRAWRRALRQRKDAGPPPIDKVALMARYIVNQADWTSVATVSSRKDTATYPFVNIISFSDGPLGNGTGIPYLYLTPLDFTAQDVFKDDRATLMMSLAQGRYCETKNFDPMDPRCARVVFSGKIKAVKENNAEFPVAKNAVFGRHPWLEHMPEDHHFFFAKLKIGTIAVLDTFGGPKYVKIEEYLHPAITDSLSKYHRTNSARYVYNID